MTVLGGPFRVQFGGAHQVFSSFARLVLPNRVLGAFGVQAFHASRPPARAKLALPAASRECMRFLINLLRPYQFKGKARLLGPFAPVNQECSARPDFAKRHYENCIFRWP